ncbi:unnamed protein product [Prunus armeniaca]
MLGCLAITGLPSWTWAPFADWVPKWGELLTILGVGFLVGMACDSFLREILENSYCLSKRGVDVHPKLREAQLVVVVATVGSEWQPWWSRCAQVDQLLPIVAGLCWSVLGLMRYELHQLSGYWEEVGGLPPAQDVERWKHSLYSNDLPVGEEECFARLS